jgi:hypothetical protein
VENIINNKRKPIANPSRYNKLLIDEETDNESSEEIIESEAKRIRIFPQFNLLNKKKNSNK